MTLVARVIGTVDGLARRAAIILAPAASRFGLVGADVLPLAILAACAIVLTLGLAAGAEVYEGVRERGDLASFDQPVLDWMIARRSPGLDEGVTTFTHLGGPVIFPLIVAVLLAVFTWRRRTASPAVVLLGGLGGALLFTLVGKDLADRTRPPRALAVPPYESSASFPSGHTVTATVAAALTAYLTFRTVRSRHVRTLVAVLALAWAGFMGLSRVFLGHHWLTDVAAGWALGLAWAALVMLVDATRVWLRARALREL